MKLSSKAIVLSTEDFGEADRYVLFLTQKWGVVSTLAKSARKSKRRYVGGLDIFCHNEIFIKGDLKERPYLQELSVLNSFPGIRDDLERMLTAGKCVQWIKRLANISSPMPGVYSLLGQVLSLIEKESVPERLELLHLVFKIKLLAQLGLKPRMDSCVKCGLEEETHGTFDIAQGGILCETCLPNRISEGDPAFISQQERRFLDRVEEMKLTVWNQVQFPSHRIVPIQRVVTQFASFHTQSKLPV